MKKTIAIALCCALILTLAACGTKAPQPTQPAIGGNPATWGPAVDGDPKVSPESSGNSVEIPNPFVEYETLAEAAAAAGFEISVPDSLDGYSEKTIRVLAADGVKMVEVIYNGAEGKDISIRKAPGADDISGDYTRYDRTETAIVGKYEVTLHGNGDTVNLATWTNGGYSFSVHFRTSVSTDTISQLVASVG